MAAGQPITLVSGVNPTPKAGAPKPFLVVGAKGGAVSGRAVLVAGTVTIASAEITAASNVQLSVQALGTVTSAKALAITARTAGTSFVITSADPTDTSIVAWFLTY